MIFPILLLFPEFSSLERNVKTKVPFTNCFSFFSLRLVPDLKLEIITRKDLRLLRGLFSEMKRKKNKRNIIWLHFDFDIAYTFHALTSPIAFIPWKERLVFHEVSHASLMCCLRRDKRGSRKDNWDLTVIFNLISTLERPTRKTGSLETNSSY